MRKKRGKVDFNQSEPAFLIGAMNRHQGWAVIVCLVGGGQEINTGEAGMEEWLRALHDHFPAWKIYIAPQLESLDYLPSFRLEQLADRVVREASLHLGVSLRSFRSERLSAAVGALLAADTERARNEFAAMRDLYPVVRSRSLPNARDWVRGKARGSERFGMLVSSGARRLKPIGVYLGKGIDPCHWFLNDEEDVRSSYYLEDAATEFEVQGLEVDWAIVIWDGDLIYAKNVWRYRAFKGNRWKSIRDEQMQRYRLNAYRVLLTRARQGLIIVVPEGDNFDGTRPRSIYDPTWEYLAEVGIPEIDESHAR